MSSDIPQRDPAGSEPAQSRGESTPRGGLCNLGEFRLLRRLGEGGMSSVYLGYHIPTSQLFAVKVLADHLAANPTILQRFRQEAKMSRELSHPNIICGFNSRRDEATGQFYLVMEYINGPTAHQRLEREGRFSVASATSVLLDIARALEYLHHRRFVHRDVKPDNILLAPDGSAKLADLGVVKHLSKNEDLTAVGEGVGTPYYMPWEQAVSPDTVDARSDLFALGATYYHLLTGRLPFPGGDEAEIARQKTEGSYTPATEHDPSLPLEVDMILDRLLARDPRQRIQSARELIDMVTASGLVERAFGSNADPKNDPVAITVAPTRADLKAAFVDTPIEGQAEQLWLIKYRRKADGNWRKLRGKTADVIRLVQNGYLAGEVYAARDSSQRFRRIRAYPEYRNAVANAAAPKEAVAAQPAIDSLRHRRDRRKKFLPGAVWIESLRTVCLVSLVLVILCLSATAVFRIMTH